VTGSELLLDAFSRVRGLVYRVVRDLSPEQLAARVHGANSIAWLVWHLTRIQDDHVAAVAESPQRWTADGWFDRFALPFDPRATGYGHTSEEVDAVRVASGDLLAAYYDAVHEQTIAYVERLTDADLDDVVDESWDPPVTLGVRLVSVISDNLQHVGQAAILHGIVTAS
jgi:uncharacterized damage-inducible protein DinB